MKKLLLILLCLPMIGFGQDRKLDEIIFSNGDTIYGNVIEIEANKITYRYKGEQTNNIITGSKLAKITYASGRVEFFDGQRILKQNIIVEKIIYDANLYYDSTFVDKELFHILTKRNNTVYIDSENKSAVIHAKNKIRLWDYWSIGDSIEESDFILKFNIVFRGMGQAYCDAQFITLDRKKIKQTKTVNTANSKSFNTKKACIYRVIEKELKPLF